MKKMNKKGFTLIELLAVIVILAVLMLLATPSVLNIMNNARKNAFATESLSLLKAAQTKYASEMLNSSQINEMYFKNNGTGDCKESTNPCKLDVEGNDITYDIQLKINPSTSQVTYKWTISNSNYKTTTTEFKSYPKDTDALNVTNASS